MTDQILPPISFPGTLHLIQSDQELTHFAPQILEAEELGFDTETRPSFRKGEVFKVALLQLATNDTAYVIRLHPLRQFQFLKQIFEDQSITKVGVAIRDDLRQLQKLSAFTPANFVELQDMAKECGLENFGLKGMTEEVLGAHLSKSTKLTNWEASHLTDQQLMYAATDAWIGLKIYQRLNEQLLRG